MQPAVGPAKHMTGILMGAETRDSHGKPFVLVVPDVSVYDPPIAPAIISPALAVPAIYADSPHLSRHRSETLSSGDISLLQVAWTDLTPSLDHQDTILAVNRRFGNSLAPLPCAADGALLARRAQANEVFAAAAFETAQTLA